MENWNDMNTLEAVPSLTFEPFPEESKDQLATSQPAPQVAQIKNELAEAGLTEAEQKMVKDFSEKIDLKLSIQKTTIMASGPISSWQIGKQW